MFAIANGVQPVKSLETTCYERITAEKRRNQSPTRKLNSSRGHVGQIRRVDLPSPRKLGSSYEPYRSAQAKEVPVSSKNVSTPRVYTRTPIGLIQKLRSLGHG